MLQSKNTPKLCAVRSASNMCNAKWKVWCLFQLWKHYCNCKADVHNKHPHNPQGLLSLSSFYTLIFLSKFLVVKFTKEWIFLLPLIISSTVLTMSLAVTRRLSPYSKVANHWIHNLQIIVILYRTFYCQL